MYMSKDSIADEEKQKEEKNATIAICRRTDERRKLPSEGFTYISTVGWICRRERKRRKGDKGLAQK